MSSSRVNKTDRPQPGRRLYIGGKAPSRVGDERLRSPRHSADLNRMPDWSEDLSQHTLEEIIALQEQNRVWQRDLRTRAATLVNKKSAKQISPDEYLAERRAVNIDVDECRRRTRILIYEVWGRRRGYQPPAIRVDDQMGVTSSGSQ